MSTADIAVIVGGVVDLAAIGAGWHLVKSGRVRLSSPTPAQVAAERPQAPAETVTSEPVPSRPELREAS